MLHATFTLPDLIEALQTHGRIDGADADIVVVQGTYDWTALSEAHIAPLDGVFGKNR
jgi:hypothetical protein